MSHYERLRPVPTAGEGNLSLDVERNLRDMGYL
jgi:hypothetical protein